jgi:hypothetical protein
MRLPKDKEEEEQKVAIVTGSSSGIGQEIALTLARNGFLTYSTMRNPMKGGYLKSLADKEKLSLKIAPLDVNNAGYGLVGAFEDLSWFYRFAYNPEAITEDDIDKYVASYSAPGGMRAGFEYYRAFPITLEQNNEHSSKQQNQTVKVPASAL